MAKKLLLLLTVVGVAAAVLLKVRATRAEKSLWQEATQAPDLR